MKNKVLIVASVVSFIEWFNKENVEYLWKEKGCEVHIACNFDYMDDTDEVRTRAYISKLRADGVFLHNIHFARSPFSKDNVEAFKQLSKLINETKFKLIHCHTPTVSILTRWAARKVRKKGCTVVYTCHGFHFHNAAPRKNWILYYPLERFFSRFCDYIVTINKEDFRRAKTFHTPYVRYIPGVGVNLDRISQAKVNKREYKRSIGVPEDCILVLSIGELIERKNHEAIIRAIAEVDNPNIYYAICGRGPLRDYLEQLARDLGIGEHVKFLGFRKDIPELCNTADISAFPSKIEGLGLAGIEAMAAGVPLVSSNVHGILDYVKDGETGFSLNPSDVEGFAKAIKTLASEAQLRENMRGACLRAVQPFHISNALQSMWSIYNEII